MSFSFFFSKKPQNLFRDMVDFHNHILPGIDDGSQSVSQSLKMLELFAELGVEKIIASPHIYKELYPNTPKTIQTAYEVLDLKSKNTDTRVSGYAAEYMVDEFFLESLRKENKLLCCFDKNILIEIPFFGAVKIIDEVQFNLQNNGYAPILAHPERYVHMRSKNIKAIKKKGVKMQLNALSLVGIYGSGIKKKAQSWLEQGLYDFVGTDAHNELQLSKLKKIQLNRKALKSWHKIRESQSQFGI